MTSSKSFPPVGSCIYCGATGVPLSDEHVVMAAIRGNLILPKASCASCSKVTSDIERIVSRNQWGAFRVKESIGRKKRGPKPSEFQMMIGPAGGPSAAEMVPLAGVPLIFEFPMLPAPAVITGKRVTKIDLKVEFLNPEILERFRGKRFQPPYVDLPVFNRVLCKTALAYAVSQDGIEGIREDVRDAILGRHPYPMDLVGRLGKGEPPSRDLMWSLRMGTQPTRDGRTFRFVGVSFFPCYGGPEYSVIVGGPRATPSRTEEAGHPAPG